MALQAIASAAMFGTAGDRFASVDDFPVRDFSNGCSDKPDAEAVGSAEEARIRTQFLDTGNITEPVRVVTIHDCIAA